MQPKKHAENIIIDALCEETGFKRGNFIKGALYDSVQHAPTEITNALKKLAKVYGPEYSEVGLNYSNPETDQKSHLNRQEQRRNSVIAETADRGK